ncbi:hypothetical protein JCM5350_003511 [Sporobolomyces pararoseus]
MAVTSSSKKRERTPILEDDDPFATRRSPKTWINPAPEPVTPIHAGQQEQRFSPLSPPPFSGLIPLKSANPAPQPKYDLKKEEEVQVETEPIVYRKPSPGRHPQFYDYSSNATSSGISDESRLFKKAPLPPLKTPEQPLTPTSLTKLAPSRKPKARFSEVVDYSPTLSRFIPFSIALPSLRLERTSSEPLFAGSTFPFTLSLPSAPDLSPPLDALVTFSGIVRSSSPTITREHILFRLGSSIKVTEPSWKGVMTIPLSSTCSTCNIKNGTLPPSVYLHGEDGVEREILYLVSASCEGYEPAQLEVEVGSKPDRSEWNDLSMKEPYELEGALAGWQIGMNPFVLLEVLPPGESSTTAHSASLRVRVRTKFRFSSTSNVSDLGTLLTAFSPKQSVVELTRSAVSTATGLGSKASAGIDVSFTLARAH